MSDFADQMDAIVVRARRVRKSIRAICLKAGVAPSTWSRWQAQAVAPNQSTIDRLNAALDEFERAA
jgi:hypothetical protein